MERKEVDNSKWFKKFRELGDERFKEVRSNIALLPEDIQIRAWQLIMCLLNDTPSSGPRKAIPEFKPTYLQNKLYNSLLPIIDDKKIPLGIRVDVSHCLDRYFPTWGVWYLIKNPKKKRGNKPLYNRDMNIYALVEEFKKVLPGKRSNKENKEKAYAVVQDILYAALSVKIGEPAIRKAYERELKRQNELKRLFASK